ncbi:MAG: LysM peptidoglycan-binding domain-containing protein [Fuerstiella sp.]|nr:LysM peptidoglycan-binding domain-containing protein [Fuerstiella sp.]
MWSWAGGRRNATLADGMTFAATASQCDTLKSQAAMHPDRKIGIAMGILLVGVVAALFFRNEPLPVDDSLSVRREQELNERLRERDVSVYLSDDLDSDVNSEPKFDLPELLDRMKSRKSMAPQPIGLAIPDDDLRQESTAVPTPSDPLRFAPPQVAIKEDSPVDNHPSDTNPATLGMADILGRSSSTGTDTAITSQQFFNYTVKLGDTLSEIAEQHLGSQARYREIYEANRDTMASPNHLRVGKAIRIPRVIRQ